MAHGGFFGKDAKAKVATAIAAIEQGSSAEVVVAVRRSSGHYRDSDFLFGFAMALVALGLLLFLPQPFALATMPVDITIAFAIGAALSANTPPLRRLITSRERMDTAVERAARATFYDLGIAGTKARTGVLVYASLFERRVQVLGDTGAKSGRLGEAYEKAALRLRRSIDGAPPDLDRFLAALDELGKELAKALPRQDGDVNELPDDSDTDADKPASDEAASSERNKDGGASTKEDESGSGGSSA